MACTASLLISHCINNKNHYYDCFIKIQHFYFQQESLWFLISLFLLPPHIYLHGDLWICDTIIPLLWTLCLLSTAWVIGEITEKLLNICWKGSLHLSSIIQKGDWLVHWIIPFPNAELQKHFSVSDSHSMDLYSMMHPHKAHRYFPHTSSLLQSCSTPRKIISEVVVSALWNNCVGQGTSVRKRRSYSCPSYLLPKYNSANREEKMQQCNFILPSQSKNRWLIKAEFQTVITIFKILSLSFDEF